MRKDSMQRDESPMPDSAALLDQLRAFEIPNYIIDDVINDYIDRAQKLNDSCGIHLSFKIAEQDFHFRARKIVQDVSIVSNLAKTLSDTSQFKSLIRSILIVESDQCLALFRQALLREAFSRGFLDGLMYPDEKQKRIAIVLSVLNVSMPSATTSDG